MPVTYMLCNVEEILGNPGRHSFGLLVERMMISTSSTWVSFVFWWYVSSLSTLQNGYKVGLCIHLSCYSAHLQGTIPRIGDYDKKKMVWFIVLLGFHNTCYTCHAYYILFFPTPPTSWILQVYFFLSELPPPGLVFSSSHRMYLYL